MPFAACPAASLRLDHLECSLNRLAHSSSSSILPILLSCAAGIKVSVSATNSLIAESMAVTSSLVVQSIDLLQLLLPCGLALLLLPPLLDLALELVVREKLAVPELLFGEPGRIIVCQPLGDPAALVGVAVARKYRTLLRSLCCT